MSELKAGYTEWDLKGNRRERIGADCLREFKQSGEHQYRMAAARIEELQAQLDAVRECQTYVVELDDCEQEWFKKTDVLKAIGDK